MPVFVVPKLPSLPKKGLIILGVALGLSGLGWWGFRSLTSLQQSHDAIATVQVSKEDITDSITGENGIVKLDNQRALKSSNTGIVEGIFVQPGVAVKQGQPLIQLRDQENRLKLEDVMLRSQEMTLQIRAKQSNVDQIRKKNDLLKTEYDLNRENEAAELTKLRQTDAIAYEQKKIEATRKQQALNLALETLSDRRTILQENQELLSQGFIAETELRTSQKQVAAAELELTNAQDDYRLSQISLSQAQSDRDHLLGQIAKGLTEPQKKPKEIQNQLTESTQALTTANLELNQAIREQRKLEIEKQEILEALRKSVITAPSDGLILAVRVKIGDVIEPKTDVILMGDGNNKIVELQLTPLDASKIKPQQQALVNVVGLEGQELQGKVEKISLVASNEGSTTDNNSAPVKVQTIVRLEPTANNIFPGTPVNVDIILQERKNVLSIPNEAIQRNEDGTAFVWMQDQANQATQQPIKIGLEGLLTTEVSEGLKEGDTILLPPLEMGLEEGQTVTTQ